MANLPKINKNNENNNINFSKAKDVVKGLLALFKIPTIPAPPVSKRTCLSATLRSGLSAKKIAAEIIKNQEDAGAIIGPNDDGSDNIAEQMELIRVQAIIDAIMRDARITIVNLPGQSITASGVTPPGGGPVQVVGTSITTSNGYGVIT